MNSPIAERTDFQFNRLPKNLQKSLSVIYDPAKPVGHALAVIFQKKQGKIHYLHSMLIELYPNEFQ